MPGYRCYFLDDQGKIRTVEAFEADDDDAARTRGLALFDGAGGRYPAIEVWQQGRRVFTHPSKPEKSGP